MFETVSEQTVEQVTHDGETVVLCKEVLAIPGRPRLSLVRKHLPDGARRPPVMLVHGFAQNRYSWHTSRRSMSAWLAQRGFDVYNLDLRGHGRSRGDARAERFTDYVEDLVRAMRALDHAPFLVGHSLGATVAYAAATEAPARGVVGIGGVYVFARQNTTLRALARLTHASPSLGALQIRTKVLGEIIGRLYGLSDSLGYAFPISGWWPGSVEPEILAERLSVGFDWTSLTVWNEMCRWSATGSFDYDEAWRALDVPLLVVLGDKDVLVPPDDGRVAFDRSGSRDKSLEIFDDFAHDTHWGHLDLVLGRFAPAHVWPRVSSWMEAREG
jgi:polyhydroxyalkanoate synthase subunit PhaC